MVGGAVDCWGCGFGLWVLGMVVGGVTTCVLMMIQAIYISHTGYRECQRFIGVAFDNIIMVAISIANINSQNLQQLLILN